MFCYLLAGFSLVLDPLRNPQRNPCKWELNSKSDSFRAGGLGKNGAEL